MPDAIQEARRRVIGAPPALKTLRLEKLYKLLEGKKKAVGNGNSHTAQSKTIQLQYIVKGGKSQWQKQST